MFIALAALIIALASLIWNIISTAYSWKFSRPDVKIVAGPTWTSGEGCRLSIDVQNKGGSAIAVEEVHVFWWFARGKARRNPASKPWLRRISKRLSRYATPRPLARGTDIPDLGPDFPCTIQAYHSQEWSFDLKRLIEYWHNTSKRSGKATRNFLILVRLSNGKKVSSKLDVYYLRSFLLAWNQRDTLPEGSAEEHGSGQGIASSINKLSNSSKETSGLGWPEV
jgi:hypothetical protein